MDTWVTFLAWATVAFALVAGPAVAVLPPDPYTTLPAMVLGIVVAIPAAYWMTYRRTP